MFFKFAISQELRIMSAEFSHETKDKTAACGCPVTFAQAIGYAYACAMGPR